MTQYGVGARHGVPVSSFITLFTCCMVSLTLASCAANTTAQEPATPASTTATSSVITQTAMPQPEAKPLAASPSSAAPAPQDFAAWLAGLKREAGGKGISKATLDAAFANVNAPLPRVIELDRSQPEFVQTFTGYMNARINDARIKRGRELLAQNKELFQRIEKQYGVQPQYLAAFWGLESNYGSITGGFSVINALATLAYDPRRSDFFRGELFTALQILQAGHIKPAEMTGSWAGAMGQCQFMPSTFRHYAVDADGDGRIDIWHSLPDVLSSAAHYLAESGWKGGERWGREVVLPANFDFAFSGTTIRKTVSEWNTLGVRKADGTALGNGDLQASVVVPAGAKGPAFLVYDNFRTIMVWNRSVFYAISVGHLADRLMGDGPIRHMPAVEERMLARADVEELQTLLNAAGVDVGTPDGVLGSRTRDAVRTYQLKYKLVPDGYASYEFLEALRGAAKTR
ncbi:MAG TPA: lytic murein transglycosylase [Candidatus Acidoferrum sp.]|nr:lytic murein transglycosylase [Candidatus Acidoferrum sp.]